MLETQTPFDLVSAVEPVREASKHELLARMRKLEQAALAGPPPATALACLQDARFCTDATRQVYDGLAGKGAQVRLFARGLQSWLGPGVLGVDLDEDDVLVDQWTLVLSGAAPVCLAAQDLHAAADTDDQRSFLWAMTRDRGVVDATVRLLLDRAGQPVGVS